jgi:hypothetical protein
MGEIGRNFLKEWVETVSATANTDFVTSTARRQ